MAVNKLIVKVDDVQTDEINFNAVLSGLSAGAHTFSVEAYSGASLIHSQTKNVTVTGVEYDDDMQAKIDYALANNIPLPPVTELNRLNQRVLDYKATGGFAKDDRVFDFTGEADTFKEFRLICIKTRTKAIVFGSPTWSADGIKGNASNAYIDPQYTPAINAVNATRDNFSIGYYCFAKGISVGGAIVGGYNGNTSDYTLIAPLYTSTKGLLGINSKFKEIDRFDKVGYTQMSRISSTMMTLDGITHSEGAGVILATKLIILGRWRGGTDNFADIFSDSGIGWLTIGANKDAERVAIKTFLEE